MLEVGGGGGGGSTSLALAKAGTGFLCGSWMWLSSRLHRGRGCSTWALPASSFLPQLGNHKAVIQFGVGETQIIQKEKSRNEVYSPPSPPLHTHTMKGEHG